MNEDKNIHDRCSDSSWPEFSHSTEGKDCLPCLPVIVDNNNNNNINNINNTNKADDTVNTINMNNITDEKTEIILSHINHDNSDLSESMESYVNKTMDPINCINNNNNNNNNNNRRYSNRIRDRIENDISSLTGRYNDDHKKCKRGKRKRTKCPKSIDNNNNKMKHKHTSASNPSRRKRKKQLRHYPSNDSISKSKSSTMSPPSDSILGDNGNDIGSNNNGKQKMIKNMKHLGDICDPNICPTVGSASELYQESCEQCIPRHRKKWSWLDCIIYTLKTVTFCLIVLSAVIIIITLSQRFTNPQNDETPCDMEPFGIPGASPCDQLEGWEILQYLRETANDKLTLIYCLVAGTCSVVPNPGNLNQPDENVVENTLNLDNLHITAIQTRDTASVYLKQSDDNTIRFVPFRKPKDTECSIMDFSFDPYCVNVHNVRSMSFSNDELSFIMAGSFPRSIEVTESSEIILNDRIFRVENRYNPETKEETKELIEDQNGNKYQNGEKFCNENIQIETLENDEHKLIIDGSCYGLLYLPADTAFFQDQSFQLLASQWSSIVIDSKIYTPEMIIAANDYASIIFRSSLTPYVLKTVITHESYVEFNKIRESSDVMLVTHEGSQIYVPQMMEIEKAFVAARNHSQIAVSELISVNQFTASVTQYSALRVEYGEDSTINYKRDKSALIQLPVGEDKQLNNGEKDKDKNSSGNGNGNGSGGSYTQIIQSDDYEDGIMAMEEIQMKIDFR